MSSVAEKLAGAGLKNDPFGQSKSAEELSAEQFLALQNAEHGHQDYVPDIETANPQEDLAAPTITLNTSKLDAYKICSQCQAFTDATTMMSSTIAN